MNQLSKGEINKYLDKTRFAEWLSDRGQADSLEISTKKIEAELDKLVSLVRLETLQEIEKITEKQLLNFYPPDDGGDKQ